jgi:hypothetical protein
MIEDVGAAASKLEMTWWTEPVPPAGTATICPGRSGGWKTRGRGRAEVYRGCAAGSGTVTVKLVDQRSKRGEIEFVVMLKHVVLDPPIGPLRGTIVLGATAADGLRGECGVATFAPTACGSDASTGSYWCR